MKSNMRRPIDTGASAGTPYQYDTMRKSKRDEVHGSG